MHKKLFKSIDIGGKCIENATYCKKRAAARNLKKGGTHASIDTGRDCGTPADQQDHVMAVAEKGRNQGIQCGIAGVFHSMTR